LTVCRAKTISCCVSAWLSRRYLDRCHRQLFTMVEAGRALIADDRLGCRSCKSSSESLRA
jgi:hypothetical protein